MSGSLRGQTGEGMPVRAATESGIVEGFHDAQNGLNCFFGVPYARPPVGNLRWKAPRPVKAWEGVLETRRFGPRCIQARIFEDMVFRSSGMSEDCLYLNIWAPAEDKGLPVLVYLYGGGLNAGDGSEPRYDGTSMARKGIVAVTVNYRLNIFGLFAHPELSAESPYKASGNYSLLDQNAALVWVKKNIASFGGDPGRVTIAGESAGSISVSVHMVSPLSRDLIAGAIGESGASIHPTMAPVSLRKAEKTGMKFMKSAGFTSLAEMKELDADSLLDIYMSLDQPDLPLALDGYLLPSSLPEIFNAQAQARVPLLLGWNSAEIEGKQFLTGPDGLKNNFIAAVRKAFPADFRKILRLYPHRNKKEILQSAVDLASDDFIAYSTWKWSDLHRQNSSRPVYRYLFSRLPPPSADDLSGAVGDLTLSRPAGAPHAVEIPYCLGNLALVKDRAWTEEDFRVSETMLNYFANFIKTGNPNNPDLKKWPPAEDDETPRIMRIDVQCRCIKAKNDGRYRALDKIYGNLPE